MTLFSGSEKRDDRQIYKLILVYCMVWTMLQWLSEPNLDSYFDMLENYAWSHELEWGTFKHPPLFSWTVGVWFSVFPTNEFFYKLFAYVNVAIALLGVVVLAKQLKLSALAYPAVLLLMWSFPYSTLAAKFNANSQLLPIWPWTAVVFMHCLQTDKWRQLAASIVLGVMAAACMLSKYFSGVFLILFPLLILSQAKIRPELKKPWPYVAIAVFLVLMVPHYRWLETHQFITMEYAKAQSDPERNWPRLFKFALMPLAYWLPCWLVCAALFSRLDTTALSQWQRFVVFLRNLIVCWRPQGPHDLLFWMCVTPWLCTLAICALLNITPEAPWAIPIGFAYTLLWLRNFSLQYPSQASAVFQSLQVWQYKALIGIAALTVFIASYWAFVPTANPNYYRPTEIAAHHIVNEWQREHPGLALAWSGGSWAETAMVEFYADSRIKALPDLPDRWPSLASAFSNWKTTGGIVVCPLGSDNDPSPYAEICVTQTRSWLSSLGQSTEPRRYVLSREGWRFPHPQNFRYEVYHYIPPQANPSHHN
jgi:4-amino-4-deoxy-L-arabinose transferase-like glycosyltransferase